MIRLATLAGIYFLAVAPLPAQFELERKSIHWRESEEHAVVSSETLSLKDTPARSVPLQKSTRIISRKIFGWHPYWADSTAHQLYDYTALSHIGYFSYDVDTATGGYTTLHNWNTTPVIDYAHQRGVKVMLTVVNFGNAQNTKILSDTNKQNRLISDLIQLLVSRNGDGVNLDFEEVPAAQNVNLVAFVRKLTTRMKASMPNSEISMATPAVDWSNAWYFGALAQACDYLIVMGYDFSGSWSSTAGPGAPLSGENYNISRTVSTYLSAGVPPEKLLLGVPWFGYDWFVKDSLRKSTVVSGSKGSSRTYAVAEPAARTYGKIFDASTKAAWYSYKSGTQWRQCWYDDSLTLSLKNDLVKTNNLAGVGIWALSYEGGRPELWNSFKAAFPVVSVPAQGITPSRLMLEQNYPNPFNPSTGISFSLNHSSAVRVEIFDILGRSTCVLAEGNFEAGRQRLRWDASGAASGMYLCRLTTPEYMSTIKMQLLR
ncbi:MAG: glycosyl hydrolase family 18 protein [Ignavibacteriales bacterium]|nr:glycosyl hydrolase family 18 protein [Ignavibacteriales bacterium]